MSQLLGQNDTETRILILGNSGAGKSQYAKRLADRFQSSMLDLDTVVWEPNQIAVARQEDLVRAEIDEFCQSHPSWVIEGCYGNWIAYLTPFCTQLVFLNPGVQHCLAHNEMRPWEPHKYASIEEQNTMLTQLQNWVKQYHERDDVCSYVWHRRVFDQFAGNKRELTDPRTYDQLI